MSREATHWVLVPVTPEKQAAGDPRLPGEYMNEAVAQFEKLGRVLEVWFHRNHDGPMIMPDGRLWNGPGLIYYAEVMDVREAPGNPDQTTA